MLTHFWSKAHDCTEWLVRRRIAISGATFTVLLGGAVALGVHPREFTVGHFEAVYVIALMLLMGGLLLRSWAAGTLIKNQQLTISGPYRLLRNPLYVGSFCMIAGTCLITDHPMELLLLVSPLLAVYVLTVRNEERRLAKRFGDAWTSYAEQVHRFLPRFTKIEFADWRLSQWLKNREYVAVLTTLLALGMVEVWEAFLFL